MSRAVQIRRTNTELVDDGGEVATLTDLRENPSALESVTRAEIDIQIATAKRFPRSVHRCIQEAKAMVAIDPDLASECTYVLNGKKKEDGSPVDGPSVRLAEILASCWGNLRIVGRVTDDDGKNVTAQAVAIDLEKNVGYSVETKRGVTTSPKAKYNAGARYSDDMVRVTCNAAIAIATRNATFKVIPMAFVRLVEAEAQKVARGDVKTLPERTERAVNWFKGKGVAEANVYEALGIGGPEDMTLDLLARLNGYKVAVNEGHATLAEVFAPPAAVEARDAPVPGETKAAGLARKLGEAPAEAPREPGSDG